MMMLAILTALGVASAVPEETMASAEVLVELLVELHVVVRVAAQHAVAAVGLVDVVDVVKALLPEVGHHQVADLVDGGPLEDAAQVHEHVEARLERSRPRRGPPLVRRRQRRERRRRAE